MNTIKRITGKEREYVSEVLDGEFRTSINGKYNKLLEIEFAKTFCMPFAIGHVNGTATMHTALVAAGLQAGDKVIVPPLTMASTSLCVLQAGMIPVYADVDRETWQIDLQAIRDVYNEDVKAIISVSLYGNCPDYEPIVRFALDKGITLIEDNAENFLGTYRGKPVGSFGNFSSYSFQASKHMTSGEGGMLLVKDSDHALIARRFNSLGYAGISAGKGKITKAEIQSPSYDRHVSLGYNYRMSELQAACALGQLERLEQLVETRNEISNKFLDILSDSKHVLPMLIKDDVSPVYWGTSVRLRDGVDLALWDEFYRRYANHGGSGFYSAWKLTYQEPYWRDEVSSMPGISQDFGLGLCPNAEFLQKRILSFPNNQFDQLELENDLNALSRTVKEIG